MVSIPKEPGHPDDSWSLPSISSRLSPDLHSTGTRHGGDATVFTEVLHIYAISALKNHFNCSILLLNKKAFSFTIFLGLIVLSLNHKTFCLLAGQMFIRSKNSKVNFSFSIPTEVI